MGLNVALWLAMVGHAEATGAADIELISQGRQVDLAAHLVPDKLVLFDFYADWCMPCRYLEPHLDRIAELNADALAIRKIDVIDWTSPVARQYQISVLPHLKLYGPGGELLAEGDAEPVLAALGERLGPGTTPIGLSPGPAGPLVWGLLAAAVAVAVVLARRRGRSVRPGGSAERAGDATARGVEPHGHGPRVWFAVVQGRLEGPFSVAQLADLKARRRLDDDAEVRRRGEATWHRLDEVLDG